MVLMLLLPRVLTCASLLLTVLQVYVDLKQVESGSLYDDFDMLAPKTIKVGCAAAGAVGAFLGLLCCCFGALAAQM